MFNKIAPLPDDPILRLSQLFDNDERPGKIDVGVGIFQDASGNTPVMGAVKAAEKILWETQTTKKYQPLSGNPEFNEAIAKLVLGDAWSSERIRVNQSTGGTGALRVIAETIAALQPEGTLWIPDPSWGNHLAVFGAAVGSIKRYDYLDPQTSEVARDKVFSFLEQLGDKDSVLLHGCCHNPSGADFTRKDWHHIVELANARGFTPIIDSAYLGLGEGIDADAYGVRLITSQVAQTLIAVSCSKNFGLYRDRVGAVICVGRDEQEASALQSHLNAETRKLISMPPDHSAAVVALILNDATLKAQWEAELVEMARFIHTRRQKLQDALADDSSRDWSFVTRHHGMFTLLPLGGERVRRLREENAIYIVGSGRINLAGLRNDEMIAGFADAVKKVLND